jgi:hypothetical protein
MNFGHGNTQRQEKWKALVITTEVCGENTHEVRYECCETCECPFGFPF